jgi:hypothetical protein
MEDRTTARVVGLALSGLFVVSLALTALSLS